MSNTEVATENKKELLAAKLELLIRDMTDAYIGWRNKCGSMGWYDMPKDHVKSFFTHYVIRAAKSTLKVHGLVKLENQTKGANE